MNLHIIFPVLNENERLIKGLTKTILYLEEYGNFPYLITIADNGSDATHQQIGQELAKQYEHVEYIHVNERGVGIALRTALNLNKSEIVGYMDVDLATPLYFLPVMYKEFINDPKVDIINASRLAKGSKVVGRKFTREIISRILNILLKVIFNIKFTDSMCGFKFFRSDVANQLVLKASDDSSWFYCGELLILAEKLGFTIKEIPVNWTDDPSTKVKVLKLSLKYCSRIFAVKKRLSAMKHGGI